MPNHICILYNSDISGCLNGGVMAEPSWGGDGRMDAKVDVEINEQNSC